MAKNKTLFIDGMTLKVGDIIQEYINNRDYSIYRISEINEDNTYMYMDTLFRTGNKYPPRSVGADINAHKYTKGDKIKTFILNENHPFRILHTK